MVRKGYNSNMKYGKKILNSLIDKYEKTSAYINNDPLTRGVYYYFKKKTIPEYFNDTTAVYKNVINEEIQALEEMGFVEIYWVKHEEGNIIDKLKLLHDSAIDIYRYLNRIPKKQKTDEIKGIINKYCPKSTWEVELKQDLLSKLSQGKGISSYIFPEDARKTKMVFSALEKIRDLQEETPKRVFSVNCFGDSKAFEAIESKVINILKDYDPQREHESNSDVLLSSGITSNISYILFKGSIEFSNGCSTGGFYPDAGIPSQMAQNTNIIKFKDKILLTIENLTTYHQAVKVFPNDTAILYLGGYLGKAKAEFIKKLAKASPKLPLYHWGDIDYGGFTSFITLENKTNLQFKPLFMDVATFNKYKHTGMPIKEGYVLKLKELLNNPVYERFHPVITMMVSEKIRIEQENIKP